MGHPHFLGLRDLHIKIEEWGARLRFVAHSASLLDADPRLWRSETRLGRVSAERLRGIGGFASVISRLDGMAGENAHGREAAAGRAGGRVRW